MLRTETNSTIYHRALKAEKSMLDIVSSQIEQVKKYFAVSDVSKGPNGSIHIVIKDLTVLKDGNKSSINIKIVLPTGFPQAIPNGFSVQTDGTNWNNICFRPSTWNPAKDNLWKWVKMVQRYFEAD